MPVIQGVENSWIARIDAGRFRLEEIFEATNWAWNKAWILIDVTYTFPTAFYV
jgi:hypothetical protein